ncbi:MAG: potassium transporter TrkG [Ilumatobacteraceae bacterium]|nr:potassium transporter TrkG [Ilumatobacteraceae bacterium]
MIFGRILGVARNPAQLVLAAFVSLIAVGTVLLRLPISVDGGLDHPGWHDSLFWATSASTVTGLGTVDVSTFSLFGELVLLALVQIGGFGIMTIGSVLAIVASRRVGLRQRMLAQAEIGAIDIGELRYLIGAIAKITILVEGSIALILFAHLATVDDADIGRAAYSSVFHGISAFNNAGIALSSDSLSQFVDDPFVVFPITAAFVIGGLGFPILVELRRRIRPRQWSLHTRITLVATLVLIVLGPLVVLVAEWTNPDTLGLMSVWDKFQAAWFQGVSPRTAGFNTIDIGAQREPTLNFMTALMFIGAGPASTSGGIKVTTFAVLGFAMWSEIRGHRDVNAFHRRLPGQVIRQATTVAFLAVGIVFATAITLTAISPFPLTETLFEAASAFGTVGLSTGITDALPHGGQLLLIIVMLIGRIGSVTFIAALAIRPSVRVYRFAEERPIIG